MSKSKCTFIIKRRIFQYLALQYQTGSLLDSEIGILIHTQNKFQYMLRLNGATM